MQINLWNLLNMNVIVNFRKKLKICSYSKIRVKLFFKYFFQFISLTSTICFLLHVITTKFEYCLICERNFFHCMKKAFKFLQRTMPNLMLICIWHFIYSLSPKWTLADHTSVLICFCVPLVTTDIDCNTWDQSHL